jgi:hypothetical protein
MAEEQAVEAPSLRDSINDAIAEVDAPEVVVATPETSTVTETPNEPAATETAKPEVAPVAESVEAKAEPETVDEVPVLGEKPADKPPASWKGDAKKVWGELPEAARNEVVRRERQVDQVLKESADARQNVEAINAVVNRHADRIREWGAPIPQVFENLLNADHILSTAPVVDRAQFMAQLIKDYNVDISALDAALSGQPMPQGQVDVSAQVKQLLEQELAPFKERIAADHRIQQQEVSHTIESMAADHVNFPYFQDVRDDMADLIEIKAARGVYLTLEQAYNMAAGGNPTVNAANQALRERAAALEADATARKAKNAASSIGGSPASVSGGADPNDLRGTIAAAMGGGRV